MKNIVDDLKQEGASTSTINFIFLTVTCMFAVIAIACIGGILYQLLAQKLDYPSPLLSGILTSMLTGIITLLVQQHTLVTAPVTPDNLTDETIQTIVSAVHQSQKPITVETEKPNDTVQQ